MASMNGKAKPAGVGMKPTTSEFGRFIRARRLVLCLKQAQLADLVGLSQTLISAMETGRSRHNLTDQKLELIAEALQCDPEELRKRIPELPVAKPTTVLGKFIRSRRKELGLSLSAFAEKMGMTQKQVIYLEMRNVQSICFRFVIPLATALNLDPSVFRAFTSRNDEKEPIGELGRTIRSRRKDLGISGEELAKKMGVSRQLVSQIELGQYGLRNDKRIKQLAQILGLDENELKTVRPKRKVSGRTRKPGFANPLCEFLIKRRLELQLTQRQVGKLAGITASYVCDVEGGRVRPNSKLLDKLATALTCEIPPGLLHSQE